MKRHICYTIDVEPDFGGLLAKDEYFGIDNLKRLSEIISYYDLKVTAFVTGKTLVEMPRTMDSLLEMKAEIEQHSYSHQIGSKVKLKDIEKGIESYEKIFGRPPNGYRAPQGIISSEEIDLLRRRCVKFDSSIFPTFFPGRFNRVGFPISPFYVGDSGIIEIPFSVVPKIRIPIGLSYMQLLGFNFFRLLFRTLGLPDLIIYDFHTYELGHVQSYRHLPLSAKAGYFRAQKLYSDPASVFELFVRYMKKRGFESIYMNDLYERVKQHVPTFNWVSE